MRLRLENAPRCALVEEPEIGCLYLNQRGEYWLVVGVGRTGDVTVLRYDQTGAVCGATRYGAHYVREKRLVGRFRVPDLEVEWMEE